MEIQQKSHIKYETLSELLEPIRPNGGTTVEAGFGIGIEKFKTFTKVKENVG